jgi:hypothetical protein
MKVYEVELRRVSYVTMQVEAASIEEAEDAAWLELQTGDYDENGDWNLNSIEELEQAS